MKNPRHPLFHRLGVLLLCMSALSFSAQAEMFWSSANVADQDTLLLYHFDEASGLTVEDAGPAESNSSLSDEFRVNNAPVSWLAATENPYLSGRSGAPGDYVNSVNLTGMDMSKGLTISFWYKVRDEAISPSGGNLFRLRSPTTGIDVILSTDPFGIGSNGRLRLSKNHSPSGNSGLVSFGAEHIWRHLAVVYDPINSDASDGGVWTFYIDNEVAGTPVPDSRDLSAESSATLRLMSDIYSSSGTSMDYDELLVQNGVITDFSNGYNAPDGQLFVRESFDYASGLLNGSDGGMGFSGSWTAGGDGQLAVEGSGNLSSSACLIEGEGGTLQDDIGRTALRQLSEAISTATNRSLYLSFLLERTQGDGRVGLSLLNAAGTDELFIGLNGDQFAVDALGGGSASGALNHETYFMVARILIEDGAVDTVDLRAYRPGETLDEEEFTVSWDVQTSEDASEAWTALAVGGDAGVGYRIDEIRLGDAWHVVTGAPPPVPSYGPGFLIEISRYFSGTATRTL